MKLFVASASLIAVTTVSFTANAAPRTLEEIVKSKELRVCYTEVAGTVMAEPAGCRDDKCTKFSGTAVEMVELYAKTLKVNVKPWVINWDEQFFNETGVTKRGETYTPKHLNSGKCDLYPNHLTEVPWRTNLLSFSILFPNRMMVVIHKDNKKTITSKESLAGLKSIIKKDSSFDTWLQELNKTTTAAKPVVISYGAMMDTFEKVAKKEVDFTMSDTSISMFYIKKNKALSAAFPVGEMDKLGWATAKESKGLKGSIDSFFAEQVKSKDSETQKIWKNYYGVTLSDFANVVSQVK